VVPLLGWATIKLAPTVPPIAVFAILNTMVHVIMYSYYALSAFGPRIQKYLWWKKYITIIQLIQFGLFITYGIFSAFLSSGYPPALYWTGSIKLLTEFYMTNNQSSDFFYF